MSLRSSKWPREGAPGPAVRDFPDQQFPDSVSLRPKSPPCRLSKPRWDFAPGPYQGLLFSASSSTRRQDPLPSELGRRRGRRRRGFSVQPRIPASRPATGGPTPPRPRAVTRRGADVTLPPPRTPVLWVARPRRLGLSSPL